MSMVEPGSLSSSGNDPGAPPPPKNNKKVWLLAGGGVVVALLVYLYAKNKSSSSSASTTTGSSSTTPSLVLPSSNQDAQNSSDYAALSGQIGNLSSALSQLQTSGEAASQPVTATTTPAPNLDPIAGVSGSGYESYPTSTGSVTGQNGATYVGVPNGSDAASILKSGGKLFYQSGNGVFTQTTGAGLQPGTELYESAT